MRKHHKLKKRSCPMCKPHKMGWEKRWKPQDLAALEEFETERDASLRRLEPPSSPSAVARDRLRREAG